MLSHQMVMELMILLYVMAMEFQKFTISIVNRWGELVFNSNDIEIKWDGKNIMNGVYAYFINVVDMLGKSHFFMGN